MSTIIKDIEMVGKHYKCTECPRVCKSLQGLSKHINWVHVTKPTTVMKLRSVNNG